MPCVGKGLEVMMRLLQKLRSGCEYKIQTHLKGIHALASCWHKAYEIDVKYAVKRGV